MFCVESAEYEVANNCDFIANGSLHYAPLLMETKKWHSLEDVPVPAQNRKTIKGPPIRHWLFNMINGNGSYRSSEVSLRKAVPEYMDLPSEKESIV